ncbi:amidohydrolase family protein [Pedobacter sp. HMF7647]|uniref:Amidohydrolase family protein n=1 Tax=Hufsiella arboris TaxID=2695275 RepID=A0A7K1Y5W5_9SPHI|nr:amidohydrolase family protein [Hufsiella arboris]MXV49974.1 amidohydrolase family protein [Hufsiella arboris]
MKKLLLILFLSGCFLENHAQETFPVNGSYDIRPGLFAFTNATIVINADQTIQNGTLLIKDGVIESVGTQVTVPKGYVSVDLKGKYIYPSLIDAFSTYGMPEAPRQAFNAGGGRTVRQQVFTTTKPGAYAWNEAIRPEMNAKAVFSVNQKSAEDFKKNGFGIVQTLIRDGIARGSSMVVSLVDDAAQKVVLKDEAGAQYSFSKGTAATNYPSSLMGSIALLRQTYYDAQWYKSQNKEYNISLAEFNRLQNLPQFFETGDVLNVLRADKIGDEFAKQYVFKTDGKEYQRIDAVKATGGSFIIPVSFPKPYDVEDPYDARDISYSQLKDWDLAPTNPAVLEKAGVKFAITSYGLDKPADFWTNIRTAIENGLSEKQALKSLTETPAELLGISSKTGSLAKGKNADFIITSGNLFKKETIIYENWIDGKQYVANKMDVRDLRGNYALNIDGTSNLTLKIAGSASSYEVTVERAADSAKAKANFSRSGDMVSMNFDLKKTPPVSVRLSGAITSLNPVTIKGDAVFADGSSGKWAAIFKQAISESAKPELAKASVTHGPVIYPFTANGYSAAPKQEAILFKNATVWTNEKDGILQNADVLIEGGKIKAVGKNLSAGNAKVIDATGKHLSPGIVDEHSHIAATGGINEGTQAVSAEVRIADVLNSDDINIYRQLAGGVTTSHILHGSANPIGGQTQLIKLRWGKTPEQLKFEGSDGFIKFALGENVKQSNSGAFITGPMRFPQTRMGVEQVYIDEFTRAKEYKAARSVKGNTVRRDLELDAIAEILDKKRFITCHSYVQSEINMLMHVADSMGFKINTFTHILEGYKLADKMKEHHIAGSTFSDWWAYKMEVAEAIPYNGKLMHEVGVLTGFNSDDAEMARRLNQEAAKAVTYGNLSQEDALKLVTLNPAKMLHVDNRIGSIKAGKDADLVLWSDNPLSIYAKAEKTFVDGIAYWDIDENAIREKDMKAEEGRIIQRMLEAKGNGSAAQRPAFQRPRLYECETLEEDAFKDFTK